ncbi:MAG: zeta toxin family protein [Myxococcaceae bacterium]|jgi:predicted ABC-type ATPase|nr:zeta toxin family protein [Myxococcaceae bacterium]
MAERARITVIAGVNGAGKSSVVGEKLRQSGGEYFNPDEVTRKFLAASKSMTQDEANSRAWDEGRRRLEDAIREKSDFVFETTLGGSTITELLVKALDEGLEVALFFVGLEKVELHIERVRSRVQAGGHDIPEPKIRERYSSSIKNLVKLAPRLTELRVFDNSIRADPKTGKAPAPRELLHSEGGRITSHCELATCPDWAKPVLAVLLRT